MGRCDVTGSPRSRHTEKITIYLTADELARLDRLVCQVKHDMGIRVDRGRIVREAIAMTGDDVRSRGGKSAVIQRLRAAP